MDKLASIKIRQNNGTYSNPIPVSVLAENVECNNGNYLIDILGNIDIQEKGNIQYQLNQLFNTKISVSELNNYVYNNLEQTVTGWLDSNIEPVGSAVVVDSSLSIEGAAADAATVGEQIQFFNFIPKFFWTYNKIISAQGVISNSNYYSLSNIIQCQEGDIFQNKTPTSDKISNLSCYHILYKTTNNLNDTFYQRIGASSTKKIVIPQNVTGYQFMFGRSASSNIPISEGDAETNVLLNITRKGLSYERLNQKLEKYVLYENLPEEFNKNSKKNIKILCIGNSFTQDSMTYMPYILNNITDEIDITLGIAYVGSSGIDTYVSYFNNDTIDVVYNLKNPQNSAWITSTEKKTIKEIIAAEEWDIITFQQVSSSQEDWSTYTNLNTLIDKVIKYAVGIHHKPIKCGWLMPQIRSSGNYTNMITCVQNVLNTTPISFVIPCGTAIQNARQTSLNNLGTGGALTTDGKHLQEGLPCLISSYVSTLKILELCGIHYKSVLGDSIRPTQEWIDERNIPGTNGTSIGITETNCYIAQKCAIAAMNNPYSLSSISE